MVFPIFTCIDYHPLPWVPDVFFLFGGDRIEPRSHKGESRSDEKIITNSQNDQLLDGLIAQLVEHCIGIAPSKFHFRGSSLKLLHKACDTPLRDVQTIHVSNMSSRDSVILLVSATNMVKIYFFTSSLVHFRRIEPKTA